MCSLDVHFTVACVFDVIFSVKNSKFTLKTHATVKRTFKLHIRNASVIDPYLTNFPIIFADIEFSDCVHSYFKLLVPLLAPAEARRHCALSWPHGLPSWLYRSPSWLHRSPSRRHQARSRPFRSPNRNSSVLAQKLLFFRSPFKHEIGGFFRKKLLYAAFEGSSKHIMAKTRF
jgi:hypothetical protein